MPVAGEKQPNHIKPVWLSFARSVGGLLVPRQDDRPLDQFLAFRDATMTLVQGEQFLDALDNDWRLSARESDQVGEALLLELRAFPAAMEVAAATEPPAAKPKGWWNRWLERASTVAGSVDDLIARDPLVKGGLALFREGIDLFKKTE